MGGNLNLTKLFRCILYSLLLFKFSFVDCFKEWWEDSKVLELHSENFIDYVGRDQYVVVKFYTKWCKYCRVLAPIYEELFEHIKQNRKDVLVARLEGDANIELCEEFGISGFPKVVLFVPYSLDIESIFHSKRTKELLVAWVEENAPVVGTDFPDSDFLDNKENKEFLEFLDYRENLEKSEKKKENNPNNNTNNNVEIYLNKMRRELKIMNEKYEKLNNTFYEIKQSKNLIIPTQIFTFLNNSNKNNPQNLAHFTDTFTIHKFLLIFLLFLICISAYVTFRKIKLKLNKI